MSSAVVLLFFGVLLAGPQSAVTIRLSCDTFSYGESFFSDQALGIWYVIPMQFNKLDDPQCIEFSKITELERQDLQNKLSKQVPDVKWENLVLKMQMPCREKKNWTDSSVNTNRTTDYFLEKLDVDGQYKTLEIPAEKNKYGRQEIHMKMVHIKYLAVLDCQGNFAFVLNNKPLIEDKELDPSLMKYSLAYLRYGY